MKHVFTAVFIATVAFSSVAVAKTEAVGTTKSTTAKHTAKPTDPSPSDPIETRRFKKKLESDLIPEEKMKSKLPPVATQPAVKEAVEEKALEAAPKEH